MKKYSSTYDYVLTSGGIGPTHDDMTYEAVAQAFDQQLHMDPTLTEMCKKLVLYATFFLLVFICNFTVVVLLSLRTYKLYKFFNVFKMLNIKEHFRFCKKE